MEDLLTSKELKTVPPKRWRNVYLWIHPDVVSYAVGDSQKSPDFHKNFYWHIPSFGREMPGQRLWPSKEIAEQKALETIEGMSLGAEFYGSSIHEVIKLKGIFPDE